MLITAHVVQIFVKISALVINNFTESMLSERNSLINKVVFRLFLITVIMPLEMGYNQQKCFIFDK